MPPLKMSINLITLCFEWVFLHKFVFSKDKDSVGSAYAYLFPSAQNKLPYLVASNWSMSSGNDF